MFGKLVPHKEHRQGVPKMRQEEIHPLVRLRREFDELWDRFLSDGMRATGSLLGNGFPGSSSIDWEEKDDQYVMRAELPGFDPKEIDVQMRGNVLTLHAEHREEDGEGNGSFRRYGSFYESVTLPPGVQEDKIDARYHSGVLEVHLPKSEPSQSKRISVKAD